MKRTLKRIVAALVLGVAMSGTALAGMTYAPGPSTITPNGLGGFNVYSMPGQLYSNRMPQGVTLPPPAQPPSVSLSVSPFGRPMLPPNLGAPPMPSLPQAAGSMVPCGGGYPC